MSPTDDESPDSAVVRAARRAREVAGEDTADGAGRADAFATLLYGLALGAASGPAAGATDPTDLAERVGTLAVALARAELGVGFREASRIVEAIGDTLAADEPDAAVLGLVHEGVQAAHDWLLGDVAAFDARIMRATGDAFVSPRALRPR